MTDLAQFLLARIAEDEADARAASPGPWHVDTESATVLAVDDIEVCDGFALSGPQLRATTRHIARHDPARVLAECRAKRRIVERESNWYTMRDDLPPDLTPVETCIGRHPGMVEVRFGTGGVELMAEEVFRERFERPASPSDTLRDLALPYADHPDFDPSWGVVTHDSRTGPVATR